MTTEHTTKVRTQDTITITAGLSAEQERDIARQAAEWAQGLSQDRLDDAIRFSRVPKAEDRVRELAEALSLAMIELARTKVAEQAMCEEQLDREAARA